MGYHMGLYMGIVVKVKGGPKEFKKEVWVDSNGIEQKTKFNPDNGEEHERKIVTYTREVTPNSYDFPEDLQEDMFWSPEFCGSEKHWENFMYQGDESKYTHRMGDPEDGFFMELSEFNKHRLIEDFKLQYKPYLDHWRALHNEVIVTYGIMAYWS